jgi:site-specific recombinase XerD
MRFLQQFHRLDRPFSSVSITDVDTHLEALGKRQWSRASIAASARGLRTFFRFAAEKGLCSMVIAPGIRGPRVYKHEGLPTGPTWSDVERLVESANGSTILDIRDHAILRLLAIYGLRRQEVSQLRLEDIDWQKDRILVRRQKQRCTQEYPLVPSVGDAILDYLQHARPKSHYREIFLTTRAPIQPISGDGLYDMVHTRLKALGIRSLRYGPHALRHACATRLMAQGLSLKHIGDHLGHRTAAATQIYAKVDLAGLLEVAEFSLRGLL